jgi:hypothetical protein
MEESSPYAYGQNNCMSLNGSGTSEAYRHALSPAEQATHNATLFQELQLTLGKAKYETLLIDEPRMIDLSIWASCCMHKEQTCFEGGNAKMMAWQEESGNAPPLLLANKQHAITLWRVLDPSKPDVPLGDAELVAFQASTRRLAATV